MPVPLDPLKRWTCTYTDCYKSFATEKEMKYHKLEEPTHFYCKKCDVDCEDWAALTEHKVDSMAPWLEKKSRRPEGAPKHIVCEFCGMDFKSMGGRELHRARVSLELLALLFGLFYFCLSGFTDSFPQDHQAQQSIQCPGCDEVFVRAGHMIGHLEKDECDNIRAYELYANIQHKYIRNEIMQQPDVLMENLQINPAFAAPPDKPGLIDDEPAMATREEAEGGVAVPLMDRESEEQKGGHQPLEAQFAGIELEGKKAPLTRTNLESWPRLSGQKASIVSEYVKNQSIGNSAPSVADTDLSASQFASQITSRRGSLKVYTESYPTLQSSAKSPDFGQSRKVSVEDDDAASVATARAESVLGRPAAWTTEHTSQALFGNVKQTPPSDEMKSILKKRDAEAPRAKDILTARWWDPDSPDYIPDRFYHGVVQKYCCPFAACENLTLDTAYDLEVHFKDAHTMRHFRCPGCLKIFKSAQGMVSHIESTLKCPIKRSKSFKQVCRCFSFSFEK